MPGKAVFLAFALLLLAAPSALAVPSVSRAELNNGSLRVEGSRAVPGGAVTVASQTAGESTVTRNADSSGNFRIEASSFRASTCKVNVSDSTGSVAATLSGCTPATTTTPTEPAPTEPAPSPSPTCTLVPEPAATYHVGDLQTFFWRTDNCRTSEKPLQFNLAAGTIPPGMTGPHVQGVASGFVTGRPTTVGTFAFTIRVRDQTGATDTETYTIRVEPARPVTITTQGFGDGRVGEFYCCGNLFSDGGVAPYTYRVVAGALPPGLSIQRFSNGTRVTGTPTTAGIFRFSLRSTDSQGRTSPDTPYCLEVHPRGTGTVDFVCG